MFFKIEGEFKIFSILANAMKRSREIKKSPITEVVKYQIGFAPLHRNTLVARLVLLSLVLSYLHPSY